MLRFTGRAFRRALVCTVSAGLATSSLVACGGAVEDATSDTAAGGPKAAAARDGETVLRGVFFGRGPVADELPQMWGDGVTVGDVVHGADPRILADEVDRYGARLCEKGCSDATREGLRLAAERLRAGERDPVALASRDAKYTRVHGPAADASINALVASLEASDPAFLVGFGADMQSGDPLRVDAAFSEASRRLLAAAAAVSRDTGGELGGEGPRPDKVKGTDLVVDMTDFAVTTIVVIPTGVLPTPATRIGAGLEHDLLVADLAARLQRS